MVGYVLPCKHAREGEGGRGRRLVLLMEKRVHMMWVIVMCDICVFVFVCENSCWYLFLILSIVSIGSNISFVEFKRIQLRRIHEVKVVDSPMDGSERFKTIGTYLTNENTLAAAQQNVAVQELEVLHFIKCWTNITSSQCHTNTSFTVDVSRVQSLR